MSLYHYPRTRLPEGFWFAVAYIVTLVCIFVLPIVAVIRWWAP